MKNFWVAREDLSAVLDLSIVNKSPIYHKPDYIGKYQLKYGY